MARLLLLAATLLPLVSSAQRAAGPLALPETDAGLPGEGPIRRYDWFRNLWSQRRSAFAEQAPGQRNAVVFLGDSITQGWKDDFSGDFADLPAVANRGISGDTTRGMLVRLEEDVLTLDPAGVVLLAGTNDLEEEASPETIAGNLGRILDRVEAEQPGTPVVLNLLMPSDESKKRPADAIKRTNELLLELAETRPQVSVLDTWSLFAGPDGDATPDLFPDLLHPNRAGYEKWRDALRPALETLGLAPVEADEFEPEPGFRPLFNGEDLTGWGFRKTTAKQQKVRDRLAKMDDPWAVWPEVIEDVTFDGKSATPDGRFVARNGRLVVREVPEHRRIQQLWTTEEFPGDFELRLQFRAAPNADSGVFVREPQLQCRDYATAGPFKDLKKYRPQDWNDLTVVVKGDTATATCNGEPLPVEITLPATGPIGLEGDRGRMEYRRIRVRTDGGRTAAEAPEANRIRTGGPVRYRDPDTGFAFPETLAGFAFQDRTEFPTDDAGYSVTYRHETPIVADVYIYDGGRSAIADGHDSGPVLEEYKQAMDGVFDAARMGRYANVTVKRATVFPPTEVKDVGGRWQSTLFSYDLTPEEGRRVPVMSEVYVRASRDRFVKVRMTFPASKLNETFEDRTLFMAVLTGLTSGKG